MIGFNAAAQVLSLGGIIVAQTVYMILAARLLGVDDFGRFSLVFSISQILLVGGDLGIHNTALRRISFRPRQSSEIFPLFFSLKVIISIALSAIAAVTAFLLPETPEARLSLLLFGSGLFFHSLAIGLNIGFQAHGKLYFASLNSFLQPAIQAALGLSGLLMGGRLIWMGFAYLAASILTLALNWLLFKRNVHRIGWTALNGWRSFVRESLPVGLSGLFNSIAARIAYSLLSGIAGSHETGIYSAASRVTGALRNVPMSVFSAVLPTMARRGTELSQTRGLCRKYLLILLAGAVPVVLGFYFLAEWLIPLIYGVSYLESAATLRILIWSLLPVCVAVAFGSVLVTQESLLWRLPFVAAASMVVNIVANALLIPVYGSRGAAIALLLTEIAAALFSGVAAWGFLTRKKT